MVSEKQIEQKFCREIIRLGGQALKFESPGMAGVPDRIVLLPDGKALFAEIKRPGQKLRPLQLKRKKDLESLGFKVLIIDSDKKIKEAADAIFAAQLSNLCNRAHPAT